MKQLQSFLLTVVLFFGLFPGITLAAPNEKELTAFLQKIDWTSEGLNDHLEYFWDHSIKDFESVDELIEFLGEPITDENLQQLLIDYEFSNEEELVALLIENGEMEADESIQHVFRYYDALDYTVSFYFYTGTEITDENLKQLLEDYGLTMDKLNALLAENDDSLENYQYIEDLDMMVSIYLDIDEMPGEEELDQMLSDLGVTDKEIEALFEHFLSINFEDPSLFDKMLSIENRLSAFGDFESADDLTESQILELMNIMQEMMDIFELDAEFSLVKGNDKKHLSTEELMVLEDTNGYDLLIELFNTQGHFLADILITADMFSSELIEDTIGDINQAEKIIQNPQSSKLNTTPKTVKTIKTIKGGKLPNTSGNYAEGILAGFALIGIGAFIFRQRNVKNS